LTEESSGSSYASRSDGFRSSSDTSPPTGLMAWISNLIVRCCVYMPVQTTNVLKHRFTALNGSQSDCTFPSDAAVKPFYESCINIEERLIDTSRSFTDISCQRHITGTLTSMLSPIKLILYALSDVTSKVPSGPTEVQRNHERW